MNSLEKTKLQQQLTYLKDNISEEGVVVDHLVTMGTFSLEQRSQIILLHSTSRENIQRMIDQLIKAGPTAFNNFLVALSKTGQGNCHVADVLKATEIAPLTRTGTFVIEKGSKEEYNCQVSEMEVEQLSLKEINKAFASLKSQVEEHEEFREQYLITKVELERKEEEYRQLKEQLDMSNEEHKQQISKLEKTIEKLQSELSSEKRKVKQLEDTINRNKEDDKKENKDNGMKDGKKTKNPNRSNGSKSQAKRPPFNSTTNNGYVSQNTFYGNPRIKKKFLPPLND